MWCCWHYYKQSNILHKIIYLRWLTVYRIFTSWQWKDVNLYFNHNLRTQDMVILDCRNRKVKRSKININRNSCYRVRSHRDSNGKQFGCRARILYIYRRQEKLWATFLYYGTSMLIQLYLLSLLEWNIHRTSIFRWLRSDIKF